TQHSSGFDIESGKRLLENARTQVPFVNNGEINGDICIDRVFYFRKYSKIVVCFDVRSEKFSFINTMKTCGKLGARCLVEQELELWVLEDAGIINGPKRSFVFSPMRHYRMGRQKLLLGMTSKGEIVYSWNSFLLFYNLESNTVKRVNIQGMEGLGHPRICHTFVNYVENMKFNSAEILILIAFKDAVRVKEYSDSPMPEDLLIGIFYLVPLKSIAMFRCVSKYCASILHCPGRFH
ncbi:hypothetical protein HID58_057833, partial [Brassica napus]